MTLKEDVNFEELARSTDEFNAAQLKAVCVEAGMIALREGAVVISHEHFHSGIAEGEWFPIMSCGRRMLIMRLSLSASEEEKPTHLLRLVLRSYPCVVHLLYLVIISHANTNFANTTQEIHTRVGATS